MLDDEEVNTLYIIVVLFKYCVIYAKKYSFSIESLAFRKECTTDEVNLLCFKQIIDAYHVSRVILMSFEPIYDVAVTLFRTKYDVAMQRNFNVTCHVNSTKVRRR